MYSGTLLKYTILQKHASDFKNIYSYLEVLQSSQTLSVSEKQVCDKLYATCRGRNLTSDREICNAFTKDDIINFLDLKKVRVDEFIRSRVQDTVAIKDTLKYYKAQYPDALAHIDIDTLATDLKKELDAYAAYM